MTRDWEKELAKIDRQLESLSDEALQAPAAGRGAPVPEPRAAGHRQAPVAGTRPSATAGERPGSLLGVTLRLLLTAALGVGVLFWPYDARCGLGLAGYLGAVATVAVAGGWSAIWSWRHRAPRAHLAALLLVGWGLALTAAEVLPRIGYARADPARALWVCE